MNVILWILQVLLALLFMFAGVEKFIMSVEEMNRAAAVPLPGLLLRFIGVCEVLGGIGLILPSLLRIKPYLTVLAALGLAIITAGATVLTSLGGMLSMATVPFVVCLLCLFVAYGRWRLKPISPK